jgi:hypothetical protein
MSHLLFPASFLFLSLLTVESIFDSQAGDAGYLHMAAGEETYAACDPRASFSFDPRTIPDAEPAASESLYDSNTVFAHYLGDLVDDFGFDGESAYNF